MTLFPTAIMTALGRAAASVLAYALAVAIAASLILPRVMAPLPVQALRPAPEPVVARTAPPPFHAAQEARS